MLLICGMTIENNEEKNKFYDLRFELEIWQVKLLDLVLAFLGILSIISSITFLLSDVPHIRMVGIFMAAVIVLLFTLKEKIFLFSGFSKEKVINLASKCSDRTMSTFLLSREQSLILGGNFYLYLLRELIKDPDISDLIVKKDVYISELDSKIIERIGVGNVSKSSKEEIKSLIHNIVSIVIKEKSLNEKISPKDIFLSLNKVSDQDIKTILTTFGINGGEEIRKKIIPR